MGNCQGQSVYMTDDLGGLLLGCRDSPCTPTLYEKVETPPCHGGSWSTTRIKVSVGVLAGSCLGVEIGHGPLCCANMEQKVHRNPSCHGQTAEIDG